MADFDEDGNSDVAVTNYGPEAQPPFGNLSILWGDGANGFSPPQIIQEGIATLLAGGDIDGDQHVDLLVDQNGIGVCWGDGTRTGFTCTTLTQEGGHGLALADIDGDDDTDVIAAHDSDVEVFLNDGARQFHSARFSAVPSINYVHVAQLDGQNGPDMVVTGFWSSVVGFLLADGSGGFQPPTSLPGGVLTADFALGEFTGDEHLDVLYARRGCFEDAETSCSNDGLTVLTESGGCRRQHGMALA